MVFVLDRHGRALMPCTEKRARLLLERNRARIHRLYPMVIRAIDRLAENSVFQDLNLKLDPGSKTTGIALNRIIGSGEAALNLFELVHRGALIGKKLLARRQMRNARRSRNTRYRPSRFLNRGNKNKGWLAPSLMHRVDTTVPLVKRTIRWAPVSILTMELVRFDMQKMQNAEISGVEYQQGTLLGYEVREYLLNKWNRTCAYCDEKNTPFEVDHIQAKTNGGSNRVSNLALACHKCNKAKDNRITNNIPKTHALDAACVGVAETVTGWQKPTLTIKCAGRGSYQRTKLNSFGFPRGHCLRQKKVKDFATGDIVKAEVSKGKKIGSYFGKEAIRKSGSFNITTKQGVVQGVSHKYCKLVQRADGYGYLFNKDSLLSRDLGFEKQTALSLPGIIDTVGALAPYGNVYGEVSRAN